MSDDETGVMKWPSGVRYDGPKTSYKRKADPEPVPVSLPSSIICIFSSRTEPEVAAPKIDADDDDEEKPAASSTSMSSDSTSPIELPVGSTVKQMEQLLNAVLCNTEKVLHPKVLCNPY